MVVLKKKKKKKLARHDKESTEQSNHPGEEDPDLPDLLEADDPGGDLIDLSNLGSSNALRHIKSKSDFDAHIKALIREKPEELDFMLQKCRGNYKVDPSEVNGSLEALKHLSKFSISAWRTAFPEASLQLMLGQLGDMLHACLEGGHLGEVRNILESRKELLNIPLKTNYTPLIDAIEFKRTRVVKLLLEFKETSLERFVNKDGKTICPLLVACHSGCLDILELFLLRDDIKINHPVCGILGFAVIDGKIDEIKIILKDHRVNVNLLSPVGISPLHQAVINDNEEITALLLNHPDIDVNLMEPFHHDNEGGNTALTIACNRGHTEIVRMLLGSKGINVNVPSGPIGTNPLWVAAHNGKVEIARMLLNNKSIDANCRSDVTKGGSGKSAFCIACCQGHPEIVKLFLQCKHEVDFEMPDKHGTTPLQYAILQRYTDIVRLLICQKKREQDQSISPAKEVKVKTAKEKAQKKAQRRKEEIEFKELEKALDTLD